MYPRLSIEQKHDLSNLEQMKQYTLENVYPLPKPYKEPHYDMNDFGDFIPPFQELMEKNILQLNTQKKTLEWFQAGMDSIKLNRIEGWGKILEAVTRFYCHHLIITDKQLEAARNVGEDLFNFLKKCRETVLMRIIEKLNPREALLTMLGFQEIPTLLVLDLICNNPHIVNDVYDNGDTILHHLVRNLSRIKPYLSAIFTARCMQNNIPFDIEKKNKENKTVLQLALELTGKPWMNQDFLERKKEAIAAILLYGNPCTTAMEAQLAPFNIKIPDILRERSDLMLKTIGEVFQQQKTISNVVQRTNQNVGILAIQQGDMDDKLDQIGQMTVYNLNEIKTLNHSVTLSLTNGSMPVESKVNNNRLFCLPSNVQKAEPDNLLQQEDPLELLRSIREEIQDLKNDIQLKSNKLAILEQKVMRIETSLIDNSGISQKLGFSTCSK